jgi:hypothetical protein
LLSVEVRPVAAASSPVQRKHTIVHGINSLEPSTATERALRRRVVRLARIKMLERRERLLREFLANAHTETPLFEDRSTADAGGGVLIGPVAVTRDFLGEPMLRAMVRNASAATIAPLITVRVRAAEGERRASIALEPLAPGESRRIELVVPARITLIALSWSLTPGF